MWKLCLETLTLYVEPTDLHLKPLCGTFVSNLGKPEPLRETSELLRMEPLSLPTGMSRRGARLAALAHR